MIESIDEWFFDKFEEEGKLPNILYRMFAMIWFPPTNFIRKWHYRIFVRGVCAIKCCDVHYSCGWNLPDDVCEWYCKRCDAEGINHINYSHEIFYSDEPLRNLLKALKGK